MCEQLIVESPAVQAPVSKATREMFTFRVEGVEEQRTALPTPRRSFDETYEIEGEHPAEALEKLLHEIEWGILDSYDGFTITFEPKESGDLDTGDPLGSSPESASPARLREAAERSEHA